MDQWDFKKWRKKLGINQISAGVAQVTNAIMAVDAMIDADQPYLLLGRLTQADVTAFIAERHARVGLGIDTGAQAPRLRADQETGGTSRIPLDRGLTQPPA